MADSQYLPRITLGRIPLASCGLMVVCVWGDWNYCSAADAVPGRTAQGKVIAAQGPQEMHDVVRAFFAPLNATQVEELRFHTDLSISLQSAWEVVRRASISSIHETSHTPSEELRYFVGFVEGRLGVRVPSWWDRQIRKLAFEDGSPRLVQSREEDFSPHCTALDVDVPKGLGIRQEHDLGIVLSRSGRSCTIDDSYFSAAAQEVPVEAVTFLFTGNDRLFVAFFSHVGGTYPIYCIDTGSGKLEWATTAWGGVSPGGGTGIARHYSYVELVASNERLVVFGRRVDSVYVEGFVIGDGRPMFHFSTTY